MKRTQATPRELHIQAGVDRGADIRIDRLDARAGAAWRAWLASRATHPADTRRRLRYEAARARMRAARTAVNG